MGKARDRAPSPAVGPPGPVRTCVGCRARATAADLLRVVVQGSVIMPDPAHRLAGRGAYLHRDPQCYEAAVRRKALTRALRLDAALDSNHVLDHLNEMTATRATPGDPALIPTVAELHPNNNEGRPIVSKP